MNKMRICVSCGTYTLLTTHCGIQSTSVHPPKFDPNDRYGRYRRIAKFGV